MKDNKNQKEEHLFSFAIINKYFIFPFLCPIFCFLANLFIDLIGDNNGFDEKGCLLVILIDSSYIGGGLLYFISSIKTKTEQTRNDAIIYKERRSSSIKYIYNDASKNKNKIYIFIILLIMSILIVTATTASFFTTNKHTFEKRLYFIFFIALFSKFILKIDIFSHQFLSLFIAFIGLILLFIPVILEITEEDIIYNIIKFVGSIGFSLFIVLCKYLTHNYYMSPYLCILLVGIISITITVLGYIICSLIIDHNLDIIINSFNFENIKIKGIILVLYFLGAFLCASILQILTILIIYYFSPTLWIVTDIISPLLTWIVKSIKDGEEVKSVILNSLGFSIVFFSSLIYNEIIICNFCGFNKNTKKYIQERQKEELKSLRETENAIQNGNESQTENENDASFDNEQEG